MKLLQRIFLLTLITVITSSSLYAQKGNKKSPEEIAQQQTKWMVKDLNLDTTQAEKVATVNLNFINKMFDARENNMGNRDAMQAAMKTLRKKKDTELKTVLSEDQFKLYKKKLAEMREQRRGNRGGGMK